MNKTFSLYRKLKPITKISETQKIRNCFDFVQVGLMFYGSWVHVNQNGSQEKSKVLGQKPNHVPLRRPTAA